MADIDAYQSLKELLDKLFSGDTEVAELAASDPEGVLAAYGVTEGDLTGQDFQQAVQETAGEHELAAGTQEALRCYAAGEQAPEGYEVATPAASEEAQSADAAADHLQYVTYAAYEQNEQITQEIVNNQQLLVDQSDNRSFEDNSQNADLDIDASGGDGGSADGTGGQAGGSFSEGDASGNGGDASGGDGGDVGPLNLNFGDGDQATTNVGEDVDDAALATGGDADNVSDNRADDGAAVSVGGDADGSQDGADPFVPLAEQDAVAQESASEEALGQEQAQAQEAVQEEADAADTEAALTDQVVGG